MPDAWLRGPIPGIDPLLVPLAHGFLHAREEVARAVGDLPAEQLWSRPGGAASAGWHLLHLAGATDRLLTYARGDVLTAEQRAWLDRERAGGGDLDLAALVGAVERVVEMALEQLRGTMEAELLVRREVGAARLPSTVLGLLTHASEHAQRHAGQLLTTVKILAAG